MPFPQPRDHVVSKGIAIPRGAQLGTVAARVRHLRAQEADRRIARAGGGIDDKDRGGAQGAMMMGRV